MSIGFKNSQRSEINELKMELNSFKLEKKITALKKVTLSNIRSLLP